MAGPTGTIVTGSSGPLYAFGPGSTTYSILPPGSPLQAGVGYWAYFTAPTPASLAFVTSGESTATLPPGQFVMIGNPGDTVATVTGADALFTWNGSQYTPVTQLSPGTGSVGVLVQRRAGGNREFADLSSEPQPYPERARLQQSGLAAGWPARRLVCPPTRPGLKNASGTNRCNPLSLWGLCTESAGCTRIRRAAQKMPIHAPPGLYGTSITSGRRC